MDNLVTYMTEIVRIELTPEIIVPKSEHQVWDAEHSVMRRLTPTPLDELVPLAEGLTAKDRESPTVAARTIGYRRAQLAQQIGAVNGPHTVRRGFELGIIACTLLDDGAVWRLGELTYAEEYHLELASRGRSRAEAVRLARIDRNQRVTADTVANIRFEAGRKLGARNIPHAVSIMFALGVWGVQS